MKKKEQFLKIYANLPLGVRKEIILVIENEPISWNAAYIEIINDTDPGESILKKLIKLKII